MELAGLVAAPDAEVEPAAGEQIDHRPLLGGTDRVVERQDRDGGAEADRARPLGERAREDRHRGADTVLGEVVLGDPDAVVPELFRVRRLGEGVGIHALLRSPLGLLEEEEDTEFHRSLLECAR